jgi:mannose-6-phosphate isomerase-like protein (cupin superfamily)
MNYPVSDSMQGSETGKGGQGDSGTRSGPRYEGPKTLAQALTALARGGEAFTRDGPRADVEYRDLGWAAASGGAIGARHIRAIRLFDAETGWHWHDMDGHFIYVLKGWIEFRYAGVDQAVKVSAGSSLSQPAGVAHNVVGRSDDLELIEVNLPADYGTWELPEASGAGSGAHE